MKYKVLALDIDGTLTNSKKEITEVTKKALIEYQEKGGIIVLASGRPTPGLKEYAEILELAKYGGYLLSFNGAKITNYKTGEVVHNQPLPEEYISKLYEFARDNDLGIVTYTNDTALFGTRRDKYLIHEATLNGLKMMDVDNFVEYIDFPVNKVLMTEEGDILAGKEKELQALYSPELSIYRSEDFFLEIMAPGIDKAKSLEHLLTTLGLTKDDMMACGDGHNDKSMIAYAGMGVAMANAKDEVKEVADYVTIDNEHDGVVAALHKFEM